MATVTPIASVRTILDAANDAAASSGVLALMEDQDVEVASLELPRTGGLVKPVDTLTLDAAGRLVVNDNDRPGGRLVSNDRRFRGMHVVADISDFVYEKVVTIPLTAAECAVNATYQLVGNVRMLMSGTPAEVAFGILDSATDIAAEGFPSITNLYGTTTDAAKTEYCLNITLKNVAGDLVVATFPESGVFWKKVYTGSDVSASTLSPSDPAATFPSSAQNMYLHIASLGGGVGNLVFDYDLELIVTKP